MLVLGIDLSTFFVDIVGLELEGNAPPQWWRYELKGADSFARARSVRDAMPSRGHWDDLGALAIGIEDPAGHHGTNHIYRIQGAVLQCLPALVLVTQWRPAAWKKAVGLAGNATKAQVAMYALVGAGHPKLQKDWPQDACDAYCIALATRQAIHVGAAA